MAHQVQLHGGDDGNTWLPSGQKNLRVVGSITRVTRCLDYF